jgi:hypothetical protein
MSDFRFDPNDPYRDRDRMAEFSAEAPSYFKWIFGGIAGLLLLGVLVLAFTNDGTQTASSQRPNVSPATTTGSAPRAPAATTGSGSINQPALPDQQNTRP